MKASHGRSGVDFAIERRRPVQVRWRVPPRSGADRATQSAFDLSHAENELEQTSRRSQARCPIQLPIQLAPKSTAC
jgi:hypothetical protein